MERWNVMGLRSYLVGGPEGLKPRLPDIIGMFLGPHLHLSSAKTNVILTPLPGFWNTGSIVVSF